METWESLEKQLIDVKTHSWTSLLQFYGLLKCAFFTAEVLPLTVISPEIKNTLQAIKNRDRKKMVEDLNRLKQILEEVWLLIQQDSERIAAGLYPAQVLNPHLKLEHWSHLLQIWIQGYQQSFGRKDIIKNKTSSELELEDMESLRDVPGHYRSHKHYSGHSFLDPKTISIYEHQMELIYLGSVDAMRRLILAPMKKHFRFSEGEGLKFLEIGCGTGQMTQFIKKSFPKAKITMLEASPIYLKQAQKKLKNYTRIDYIQGDAIDLPFKEETFDAVYSSFLLHEMSLDVRKKVISESHRVLRPRGWLGFVDLIQVDDYRDFNWVLDQSWFVGEEPHLKEYVRNNLAGNLKHQGFEEINMERGFLGKVVFGTKSESTNF